MIRPNAFTLVELLVSMALFVTLMGVSAYSFMRVSSGGEKTLQVLQLHNKADAILRYMESDVRNMQQSLAMHLRTDAEPYTLTFMKPVNDTVNRFFHKGKTLSTYNIYKDNYPRFTDIIWVRWSWEDGSFSRGQSRNNTNMVGEFPGHNEGVYIPRSRTFVRTPIQNQRVPNGIQNNAITPTPQREYKFFEGVGASVNGIDANGGTNAGPANKVAVYKTVSDSYPSPNGKTVCSIFDLPSSPWRSHSTPFLGGDVRHLHTTIECGNDDQIADAYAVRNADGKMLNKDRLNLIGSDAVDGNGDLLYPSQMNFLFDGIEFLSIELYRRDGKQITTANEDDTINDGADSIDVSGIDPLTGDGYDKRPSIMRFSYLLHSVDREQRDIEDYDLDGVSDEPLASAIRTVVNAEGGTRLEKIHSYKRHALKFGFASIVISQSVQLGL